MDETNKEIANLADLLIDRKDLNIDRHELIEFIGSLYEESPLV